MSRKNDVCDKCGTEDTECWNSSQNDTHGNLCDACQIKLREIPELRLAVKIARANLLEAQARLSKLE